MVLSTMINGTTVNGGRLVCSSVLLLLLYFCLFKIVAGLQESVKHGQQESKASPVKNRGSRSSNGSNGGWVLERKSLLQQKERVDEYQHCEMIFLPP